MSAMTDYLESALGNEVLRATNYAAPANIYVALFTTATADDGTGTEVTGNAYARQAITFDAPSPAGVFKNNLVTFPAATPAGWGTVTHFAIFDADVGGNMLIHGALTAQKAVGAGDVFTFPDDSVVVSFQ